ncbi:MAG: fasciclin domain-containing protein [Granulosicoccus sp.]
MLKSPAASLSGISIQAGNGHSIVLPTINDALFVNKTRITVTDVMGVNSVMHAVESVLLPPVH